MSHPSQPPAGNGPPRWAATAADESPTLSAGQGPPRWTTERERLLAAERAATAALREEQERFQATFELAAIGIALVAPDGRWLRVNQRLCDIVGYDRERLLQRTFQSITHPDDLDADVRQAARVLSGEIDTYQLVKRYVRGDGGVVWAELTVSLVRDADTGQPRYFISVINDVSARKRAEDRARQLQDITTALAAAATRRDVARVVARRCAEALGADAGALDAVVPEGDALEVIESFGYPADAIDPWQRPPLGVVAPITDAVRTGQAVWLEDEAAIAACYPDLVPVFAQQGTRACAAVPLVFQGRVIAAQALTFNAPRRFDAEERAYAQVLAGQAALALDRVNLFEREQRARTEAEVALRTRDEFLAAISHDLRTPLATLKGRLQLLRRRAGRETVGLPEWVENSLHALEATTSQMTLQVDELLDVARLQAGQPLGLDPRPLDLAALVRESLAEHAVLLRRHGVEFDADAATLLVAGDPVRLRRVLGNVLSNAAKYSPRGSQVRVSVTREADANGEWAVLRVADQGIGIPPADLPRIFARFFRAANADGVAPGTGLGLSGARQIVEGHGGTMAVASQGEGQGSTFTVRLPLVAASPAGA